jgi:serine/threonine protein kinase
MLDSEYNLKIIDFGFAAPVEGRDGSGYLLSKLGTLNYMAPEIHLKQPYQGRQVDLFAAAIILFIMVAQHPPFSVADPNDAFYKCLAANRANYFWNVHCKNKPNGNDFFSKEFKEIIQGMLQLDPTHRPSIADVLAHPWMQGPTPSKQEVMIEFQKRHQEVQGALQEEAALRKKEKEQTIAVQGGKKQQMRSALGRDQ